MLFVALVSSDKAFLTRNLCGQINQQRKWCFGFMSKTRFARHRREKSAGVKA